MDKVGKEGVITVEEAKGSKPRSMSSKACNSTAVIFRPTSSPTQREWNACSKIAYLLIHEKKISNMKEILPVLEQVAKIRQTAY